MHGIEEFLLVKWFATSAHFPEHLLGVSDQVEVREL
jgi:hypothetical protein